MDYLSILLCLLIVWGALHFFIHTSKRGNESKNARILPPGPPALPIIGNLLSLGKKPHISLTELSQKYGPLMTLQLGQVRTVVISSAAMAKEALQKNNLAFSKRNVVDALSVHNYSENAVAWLPPGPQWRKLRRICNSQLFSPSRLAASQTLRRKKVNHLLTYVKKYSEAGQAVVVQEATFTTFLNLVSSIFFSIDMGDPTSDFASKFRETVRGIARETGKPNLADYFPLLKMIDPQGIRRHAKVHFGKMINLFEDMIDQRLKGKRPSGSAQDYDVLDTLLGLSEEKNKEIERSTIPYLLTDLFAAGSDTSANTLEWAMAELLRNPDKLKKAQAELLEIVGKEKAIKEQDIPRLPYLQAIVKETFRLHPPVPFLLPRKVDSDVKLFEYTVPKNAQVLVNVWAIGRDPDLWENPTSFEPERFLGSKMDVKGCDFELIPFGAGLRICPGLPLAIPVLHLMLGSLIHGFDWKLDEGFSAEDMDMEENFGLTLEKVQRLRAIPIRV